MAKGISPLRAEIGKRDVRIRVALTGWELEKLEEMCKKEKSTMAELIRRKVFNA